MDNVVAMPSRKKQFGINISFTIQCNAIDPECFAAQAYLEQFHDAVQKLRLEGFPRLTATVSSRQEYLP